MIYAQINEENICTVISDMGKVEVSDKHLIPIEVYDTSLIGKKYNKGAWKVVPQPEPQPSQLDRIEESSTTVNNNSLILMEAMAEQYEQGLTNRLNDMEVQATIYEAVLELNKGGAAV